MQSPPVCDLEHPIAKIESQQSIKDDDQMERFSETSSIELVIQGGPTESQLNSSAPQMRIPESHHFVLNPYPGVKHQGHIPVDIVKSFTPVAHSEHQRVAEESGEIFSDYMHDPYNLTLQIDSNKDTNQVKTNSASNFFQSSSYFSNDTSDLIPPPPGSELFNRP